MEIRIDRVGLLVEQLTDAVMFSRERIDGMSDDEFLWEPVSPCWSIRSCASAATPDAFGPGQFVLDADVSVDPFEVGPFTTIAWRVGHLLSAYAGRFEWTFGRRATPPADLVEFTPEAGPMVAQMWDEIDRWVAAVEAMTDVQLDEPGFGQYPMGMDPRLPFIGIVRWMNRETIHHLAEVALLRDLYAARGTFVTGAR